MAGLRPLLLSAITCNRVIFDRVSGMPSVIDIVQNINARSFPARHWQLVFFCELTNGHGKTETKIALVDSTDDDKVIFEQTGVVEFKDVKQTVTLAANLRGLVFPHPGEYRFQLYCEGNLLGERRIMCRQVEEGPGQQPGGSERPQGFFVWRSCLGAVQQTIWAVRKG